MQSLHVITASSPSTVHPNPFRHFHAGDSVTIRGRRLEMGDLVDPKLFDAGYIDAVRLRVENAMPFKHLNEEGWFNPVLLELAREEFADLAAPEWTQWTSRHQQTFRSPMRLAMGPASYLYFSLVNAGWFVDLLSSVMGVDNLIPDPQLHGGGLHESRNGGRFGIHRDFDRHARTGLQNRLSLMTYLNRDWDPSWGGALELWDEHQQKSMLAIQPDFNRSVVLCHGPASFHGHPHPLKMPDGVTRRSLAAYYYTNNTDDLVRRPPQSTVFMLIGHKEKLREAMRSVAPPILWRALKRALRG